MRPAPPSASREREPEERPHGRVEEAAADWSSSVQPQHTEAWYPRSGRAETPNRRFLDAGVVGVAGRPLHLQRVQHRYQRRQSSHSQASCETWQEQR